MGVRIRFATHAACIIRLACDKERLDGWQGHRDWLLRMDGGGLNESKSADGLVDGKIGFLAGGANSTLMDGGAICDA